MTITCVWLEGPGAGVAFSFQVLNEMWRHFPWPAVVVAIGARVVGTDRTHVMWGRGSVELGTRFPVGDHSLRLEDL